MRDNKPPEVDMTIVEPPVKEPRFVVTIDCRRWDEPIVSEVHKVREVVEYTIEQFCTREGHVKDSMSKKRVLEITHTDGSQERFVLPGDYTYNVRLATNRY